MVAQPQPQPQPRRAEAPESLLARPSSCASPFPPCLSCTWPQRPQCPLRHPLRPRCQLRRPRCFRRDCAGGAARALQGRPSRFGMRPRASRGCVWSEVLCHLRKGPSQNGAMVNSAVHKWHEPAERSHAFTLSILLCSGLPSLICFSRSTNSSASIQPLLTAAAIE